MGKGKPSSDLVEWTVGTVAQTWEKDHVLRARSRQSKELSRWPSNKTKGIPSMQAMQLNGDALHHLALAWCPLFSEAKSPSIPVIRAEVSRLLFCIGLFGRDFHFCIQYLYTGVC